MAVLRTVPAAAYLTQRNPDIVRRWVYTGRLTRTACDINTRALLVDLAEALELNTQTQRRTA